MTAELLRPDRVYEAVLGSGAADLGFISYPENRRDLTVIPWRDERMTLAVYPSHPLASKAMVRPEDLDGQNFVAFDEEVIIRRELDRFFRESGVAVKYGYAVRQYSVDQTGGRPGFRG